MTALILAPISSVSTDHGQTCRRLSNLPSGTANTFALAPPGSQVVYAAGESGVFKSVDGAASWTPLTPVPGGIAALTVDPARPQVVYGVNSAGIYKTIDGGATWFSVGPPFATGQTPLYVAITRFIPTLFTLTSSSLTIALTTAAKPGSPTSCPAWEATVRRPGRRPSIRCSPV